LNERKASLAFADIESEMRPIDADISQGSPILSILFLFFNADLLENCERLDLKIIAIGFVNDINILAIGSNIFANCERLNAAYGVYNDWASRHGAEFALDKYELIHFSKTPRKFNMAECIRIDDATITPKPDIRVLGVQLNIKFRWKTYLKAIEIKNALQMLALSRLSTFI